MKQDTAAGVSMLQVTVKGNEENANYYRASLWRNVVQRKGNVFRRRKKQGKKSV